MRFDIVLDKCSHFHSGMNTWFCRCKRHCMADANNVVEGPSEGCSAVGFALEIDECKPAG